MSSSAAKLEAPNLGFTTEEALKRLYDDIEDVLIRSEYKFFNESYIEKVKCSITKPYENPLGWFQLLIAFVSIIILYVINYYFSATFLLILFVITFYIVIRENSIRRTEIHRKIRQILNDISLAKTLSKDWIPENYPNLCCPLSPCVTLQWTYRDGRIVNLPWALLVRGDYIVIRPGQIAPGLCSEVNGLHKFKCGETYGLSQPIEPPLKPTARPPLPDLVCVMESTPYLENLKTTLNNFLNRPATTYNQQRYLLITKYIQQWGILFSLILTLGSAILQYWGILFTDETPLVRS